uniref:Zinc finger protein 431-like isoform X4 n=1 Tax=Diabrotica virgifera virgifera TaxID=50390 RepID=A0A6P7G6P2_DIAVI
MDIKHETSEKTCKIEVEQMCDGPLDAFKVEIKEEPKTEPAYETFGYLDLNEFPLKTEEQDEYKFTPFEEKQTTNEESCSQKENTLKIMETLHSPPKGGHQVEGKILNKNMKIVTGDRHYKCEICFKQFTKVSRLKVHLRTHSGEKPYKCEICLKQFARKGDLNKHLTVHNGEKPHKLFPGGEYTENYGNLKFAS